MEALIENWFFVAVLLFCIGVHFLGHGHGRAHDHEAGHEHHRGEDSQRNSGTPA